ncbi:unnamed protein product [Caenorhabditis auriculariae]|uniref:Uncharacterized protein n=1 Tax=Caenorhabditis auriculariae TaxID=2777116 RepID=A0A8S1HEM0_9PELO|nr:unnamed protein product [Caenorhabditis auriculariae]
MATSRHWHPSLARKKLDVSRTPAVQLARYSMSCITTFFGETLRSVFGKNQRSRFALKDSAYRRKERKRPFVWDTNIRPKPTMVKKVRSRYSNPFSDYMSRRNAQKNQVMMHGSFLQHKPFRLPPIAEVDET